MKVLVTQSCLTLLDPILYPRNSPGKNTGVGSHSLLQGIFPIEGSNPGLHHYRQILYHLSHQGKNMNRHWGNAKNSCLYHSSPACNNLRGNHMEEMSRRLEEQGSTRFGGTRFSVHNGKMDFFHQTHTKLGV